MDIDLPKLVLPSMPPHSARERRRGRQSRSSLVANQIALPATPARSARERLRARRARASPLDVGGAAPLAGVADRVRAVIADAAFLDRAYAVPSASSQDICDNVVVLNIYDVAGASAINRVNQLLRPVGTGLFHAGVQIYGEEWSFGASAAEDESAWSLSFAGSSGRSGEVTDALLCTGVFSCEPRGCEPHRYRESVVMGRTRMSPDEVRELLDLLQEDWLGLHYDVLRRNCCHFADSLCQYLGVGPVPAWVTNLAGAAATLQVGAFSAAAAAVLVAEMGRRYLDTSYAVPEASEPGTPPPEQLPPVSEAEVLPDEPRLVTFRAVDVREVH